MNSYNNLNYIQTFIAVLFLTACSQPKHLGVDYHVHITSPEMAQEMKKLCGTDLICPDGNIPSSNANDIEKVLDSTIFSHAIVLSGAYFAGMPEMELDIEVQKKLTRAENQFVANQVNSSKKLFGFFSVNPLSDYALEESKFCIDSGQFNGIKLHLGNSNFDYFNPQHIKKLQNLLQLIDQKSMYIMLHGRTRNPEYGQKDIEILINKVISHTSNSTWILAHATGWGGYDQSTDIALATVINALNSNKLDKSKVFLDISAIVIPESSKNEYPISKDTLDKQTKKFLTRFHALNIDNWLFGSDWAPNENELEPNYYFNELIKAGLDEKELKTIVANKLDFIQ